MIDFESNASHLLLNPRMPREERDRLERMVPKLDGHVFVATSGSTGAIKLVALSKQAILASAAAVNSYLNATSAGGTWCCVLPDFHVGGLGIHARAFLSGARVVTAAWEAHNFADICARERVAFASLVPAQVRDLVRERIESPGPLCAILAGGGALDRHLQQEAGKLGWPMLATYGLSECCSTVAVEGTLLDHLDARREDDGRLAFRGASLFTGYATEEGLINPKVAGWFISEDLGEVEGRTIHVHGRAGDFVKIGGESVDLKRLDRILHELAGDSAVIVAVPDERLGHVIHLASTIEPSFVDAFNARVHPFERIRAVHRVDAIPRSPLGKLLRAELLGMLPI
jgi:O-succinylbenzoic acid--CoA ligase